MLVRDIMTRDVNLIQSDDTVREAANRMRDFRIGALPVTNENEVIGMITDRDIVNRAVAEGIDITKTPVRKIMTSDRLQFIRDDDSINRAAEMMSRNQVRRLIVRSNDNKISGVLSIGDIARNAENELAGSILTDVSSPENRE